MKKLKHLPFFSFKIIKKSLLYIYIVLGISIYSQSQIISKIDSIMGFSGDTLIININVTNFSNVSAFATEIILDNAALSLINVHYVDTNLTAGAPLFVSQIGSTIKSSYINPVGSATLPDGILYGLAFIYNGGSCCLHGSGDYGGMPTLWIDGCVSPLQLSLLGQVTYDDTLSPHQPITNTLLKLYNSSGILVDSTFTNQNGDYFFTNMLNGIYNIEACCTKPWGGGNALDALIIMYNFTGLYTLVGLRWQAGDIDGSNFVTTLDAMYVMQRFVMLINSFPAGDWVFENNTITINGTNVVNNFKGLCVGDVNGSYILP